MRFSERCGFQSPRKTFQINDMDESLRALIWNDLTMCYWNIYKDGNLDDTRSVQSLVIEIWSSFLKKPIDDLSKLRTVAISQIRKYFFSCEWYEVYDFIEFIANNFDDDGEIDQEFIDFCNCTLEKEMSGYRFVYNKIAPITSESEIKEVEEALYHFEKFRPVSIHIDAALRLMSDKENPDYRNSIKESISAVESACMIISGDSKATLGKALTIIEKKHPLHGSLKASFDKLYGYTSDAEGIRHALLTESNLDLYDAKFMLVACSSFVNYLIAKTN
ncbi:AbiJ-NTD4 domain-containing protein [Anaerospora hongkongensis]|uniref:AbiJ-NTD4 domain-containing protein n=1 Tax=Anaerospora hongkongensis TaxID=244830 RepID=UPI00289F1BA9|nr:hypothetical protein [Anaerospora hongkongensis]